jgi:mono/diheme cytochrome c family protein
MKTGIGLVLASGISMVAGVALAQTQPQAFDLGKYEYESKCASCHGNSGQGFGPLRPFLVTQPADLTTLARRNGGTFPNQIVWLIIDGRTEKPIGAHGSREMPVWGSEYRQEALRAAGPEGAAFAQPEWYVRGRIVALLDYLSRMQVK